MLTQAFSEIWNRLTNLPKLQRSLSEAAEIGDDKSVAYWIKLKGSNPCEIDDYGYFPLLNASLNNRIETVKELLLAGADVNQKGPHGYTSLHGAAQNGLREIAELLIEAGAELNPRNDDKDTPLLLATRSHQIEMIALLSKAGCDATIHGYCMHSSIELARQESLSEVAKCLEYQSGHSNDLPKLLDTSNSHGREIFTLPSMSAHFIPNLVSIDEDY